MTDIEPQNEQQNTQKERKRYIANLTTGIISGVAIMFFLLTIIIPLIILAALIEKRYMWEPGFQKGFIAGILLAFMLIGGCFFFNSNPKI